jgi:hypothetical protein
MKALNASLTIDLRVLVNWRYVYLFDNFIIDIVKTYVYLFGIG